MLLILSQDARLFTFHAHHVHRIHSCADIVACDYLNTPYLCGSEMGRLQRVHCMDDEVWLVSYIPAAAATVTSAQIICKETFWTCSQSCSEHKSMTSYDSNNSNRETERENYMFVMY